MKQKPEIYNAHWLPATLVLAPIPAELLRTDMQSD